MKELLFVFLKSLPLIFTLLASSLLCFLFIALAALQLFLCYSRQYRHFKKFIGKKDSALLLLNFSL